jgi:hypothetical protein
LNIVSPSMEWWTGHQETPFTRRCLRVRQLDILHLHDTCALSTYRTPDDETLFIDGHTLGASEAEAIAQKVNR